MIRNCCFEYEKYEEGILFVLMINLLLLTNIEKRKLQKIGIKGIDKIYFPNFSSDVQTEEDKGIINALIIDILFVLTNNKNGLNL